MKLLPFPSYWAYWSYLVARRWQKAAQGRSVAQEGVQNIGVRAASTWGMRYMAVPMGQPSAEPAEEGAQVALAVSVKQWA